jgi:hypothetical protein
LLDNIGSNVLIVMNWKGGGKRQSWNNFWYYHGRCLEDIKKNKKIAVSIISVEGKTRTGHLQSTSQIPYRFRQLLRSLRRKVTQIYKMDITQ